MIKCRSWDTVLSKVLDHLVRNQLMMLGYYYFSKYRIRETLNLLTNADSSTDTKRKNFFLLFLKIFFFSCFFWVGELRVSEFPSFWVTKFPSFQGREGGPMTGLELIMWYQGQWGALKKMHPMAQTDRQTHRHTALVFQHYWIMAYDSTRLIQQGLGLNRKVL